MWLLLPLHSAQSPCIWPFGLSLLEQILFRSALSLSKAPKNEL